MSPDVENRLRPARGAAPRGRPDRSGPRHPRPGHGRGPHRRPRAALRAGLPAADRAGRARTARGDRHALPQRHPAAGLRGRGGPERRRGPAQHDPGRRGRPGRDPGRPRRVLRPSARRPARRAGGRDRARGDRRPAAPAGAGRPGRQAPGPPRGADPVHQAVRPDRGRRRASGSSSIRRPGCWTWTAVE